MKYILSILLTIYLCALSSASIAHNGHHLGQIQFTTTGKPAAQPYFEQGIMYLHSFQYDEARANFQKAEKIDPDFALAFWGDAMTYNHPLWGEQDYDGAVKTLERFAKTAEERVEKAKTAKEKGFMNAVNILYGKGDKATRDNHYVDAMRELYRQSPEDDEIAMWYTLALLGSAEAERDTRVYMQAAGVAEDIYARNKHHPGALHYVIHAYDDPIHAPLGLRAARAYAKAAPEASHALHMPSHIFNALGLWDDVINSNQAAWDAGVKLNKSGDPTKYTIHDLHALQWLAYGHLQKQHYQTAYHLTKIMENIALKTQTPKAKWYYAQMRGAYLTDSQDNKANLASLDMSGVELSALSTNIYADVLVAKRNCDTAKMQKSLTQLMNAIPQTIPNKTYTDYFTSLTQSGVLAARITVLEIKAHIAQCQHQTKQAIQFLQQAAKMEEGVSFGYGPPIPVKPSFELLADMLQLDQQYTEAYKEYIVTLKRMPNRTNAVQGAERAKNYLIAHHMTMPTEEIKPYFHRLILPEYFH